MIQDKFSEIPWTPKDVAKNVFHNKISYGRILRMAKSGELPFILLNGRFITFPRMMEQWLTKQEEKANKRMQ